MAQGHQASHSFSTSLVPPPCDTNFDHWVTWPINTTNSHRHSFNHMLNHKPSLIQSVTATCSSICSPQTDTCSDEYPGVTSVAPSIRGCWTYEDSSSSYGWRDDVLRDSWQPYNKKDLAVRAVGTIGLVFYPGLIDLVPFTTERTYEPSLDLDSSIRTMLGPMVLMHPLSTCILLTTVRACNPVTCHTNLCVSHPHPWEFLTTVYSHVNHQAVVGFERLLAHWTVIPLSGYSRNLVWHLCDFPGLGSFRQVLPMKKSWHLDTFRTEHSSTNFSKLVLAKTKKTASHSFTYSFIFSRQKVALIHTVIWSFTHSHLWCRTHSFTWYATHSVTCLYIQGKSCHSFTKSFNHSPICTSGIEVIHSIICDDNTSFFHCPVMPDAVLLQSFGVQDSDLHQPHTRDGMQDYLIIPEKSLWSNKCRYCLNDYGGFQPLLGSAHSLIL